MNFGSSRYRGMIDKEGMRSAIKKALASYVGPEATRPPFDIPSEKRTQARAYAFEQVVRRLDQDGAVDALVEAAGKLLDDAVEQRMADLEEREESLAKKHAEVDRSLANVTNGDPIVRRVVVCKPLIEDMLPLCGRGQGYAQTQSIRSRGLAIAALAGMTSFGPPPVGESDDESANA